MLAACVAALLLLSGWQLTSPPAEFPVGNIVTISQGASAPEIAQVLADEHIITHPRILQFLFRISGTSALVQSGAYLFQSPQNLLVIAYRLITGSYGVRPVRITFPEGTTVREMATQVAEAFPSISAVDFSTTARPYEGYLFPDTYFFSPSSDATSIVAAMRTNFNAKIASSSSDITASGHSFSDIIIMASLIEREARTDAVRRIVAGILYNRLKLGMPLQVDAVFGYIFNRDTYSPSLADLKVNSPYNTYTHTGLPLGPINNPGLDALDAAIHPTKTEYLYYLTDPKGVMHYATTFADHQANQNKYLK